MAVSKAQQASVNKYVKSNYDRINVTMPKGEKEIIQGYAAFHGESVNGFIVQAIRERIERDSSGAAPGAIPQEVGISPSERVVYRIPAANAAESPQQPAETLQRAEGVPISSDVLETAQKAAERTGETLPDFVARAVTEQNTRDERSFKMGINPA